MSSMDDYNTWEEATPYYRNRWQERYGTTGSDYSWQDYEPGYRYGWEMRNRPEYRGRSWSEVEPEFRRDWGRRYHDKPWDRFADAIRDAWEGMTDRGTHRYDETRTTGTHMGTTRTTTGTNMGTTGSPSGFNTWDEASPYYRNRWQDRYGTMGNDYSWRNYEPAYRYGWEMYNRPEYRGRSWNEVEPEFKRDWGRRYHDKPWDRFGDAIRDAWEGMTDRGGRRFDETRTTTGTRMGTTGTTRRFNTWDEATPYYRNRWQERYGTSGSNYTWQDYEPAYRYGWEMYNRPEYQGRSWSEVEPELKRDWTRRYHDRPWDRFSDAIRDTWEGQDRWTIQLREEQLRARKRQEEVGEVGIRKEVVTDQQSLDVPVTHEEVYIERRAVDRPSDRPIGEDEDETIRMAVHDERVIPEKDTVVREELGIHKREVQETEHLSDTVRREEVRIEKEGDVRIAGEGTGQRTGDHEHKWVGDRCEICGATRRNRRSR